MDEDLLQHHIENLRKFSFNCSTVYEPGLKCKNKLDETRALFANLFKVDKKDIIFTSGGTESNNMAINCTRDLYKRGGVIWYSTTSHPSLLNPIMDMGDSWKKIPLPLHSNGNIDYEACLNLEKPNIIATEWVNSEVGLIRDIDSLTKFIEETKLNASLVVDGVQGLGKIALPNLKNITAFTFSGHKCGAPVGVGGIILNNAVRYSPMLLGGGQEKNKRSGTESTPSIITMWEAINKCEKSRQVNNTLNWHLDSPKKIRKEDAEYSPYIYLIDTSPVEGEVLLHHLEEKSIYIGLGSACSASKKKISNTHKSLGLSEKKSRCTIRISFSPDIEQGTLNKAQDSISEVWQSLKKFF
jgi:cysteine desulfurase